MKGFGCWINPSARSPRGRVSAFSADVSYETMSLCWHIFGRRDALGFLLLAFALLVEPATAQDAGAQIHWKPVETAQVRLDDKAPIKWNVYQPDKKDKKDKKRDADLVLVLLGHRYLMLDTKARLVFVVPLAELHAQGNDFETGDLAHQSNMIPSTDWTERDVGPAELYRLTLGDYNRVLEVSLPHMPDLRAFY
jgi:hypothetical protein